MLHSSYVEESLYPNLELSRLDPVPFAAMIDQHHSSLIGIQHHL